MRVRLAVLIIGLGLAGCTTTKPSPALPAAEPTGAPPAIGPPSPPQAAAPPERTSCVPRSFPRAPRYPDTDQALRAAGGAADRYQLLAAGRLARSKRLAELERLVDACR
jgi:hypothetical protein